MLWLRIRFWEFSVKNFKKFFKGDNEDGNSLAKRGVLNRRVLNLQKIFNTGVMHSKLIVADNKHFYLGSANLDWRSLTHVINLLKFTQMSTCLSKLSYESDYLLFRGLYPVPESRRILKL